eukprot:gene11114-biopygen4833
MARAWRGRGAGYRPLFGLGGAGVARVWRGHRCPTAVNTHPPRVFHCPRIREAWRQMVEWKRHTCLPLPFRKGFWNLAALGVRRCFERDSPAGHQGNLQEGMSSGLTPGVTLVYRLSGLANGVDVRGRMSAVFGKYNSRRDDRTIDGMKTMVHWLGGAPALATQKSSLDRL